VHQAEVVAVRQRERPGALEGRAAGRRRLAHQVALAEDCQRARHGHLVAEPLGLCHRPSSQRLGGGEVAREGEQVGVAPQGPCPQGRRLVRRRRQDPAVGRVSLGEERPQPPPRPERDAKAQRRCCVGLGGEAQRLGEVGALEVERVEDLGLARGQQLGEGGLGDGEEGLQVALPGPMRLAGLGESLQGVAAHGLEQAETQAAVPLLDRDQRAVGEGGEQPEDLGRLDPPAGADALRRPRGDAAGEDPQATEQRALRFCEKVVAPVDRGAQRALARKGGARSTGQEAEAIGEPVGHHRRRQRAHPGRRELDRQGNAVELSADADHGRRIGAGEHEASPGPSRALHEQPHGIRPHGRDG
jgi:hypothetical protein